MKIESLALYLGCCYCFAATGDRCYVALKDLVAISNGSACTSSSYTPSHVIKAMGYGDDEANEGNLRLPQTICGR